MTAAHGIRARMAPGRRRDIGLSAWAFSRAAGRVMGTEPPAVFTTLARSKGLFWGWLHFAGRLMPFGVLGRRESELLILTVADAAGCDYEFEHHVILGRRAGVTVADVADLRAGVVPERWSERERVLVRAAKELHQTRDLGDESWSVVSKVLSEKEILGFLMLTQHYEMLATVLGTLRIPPDAPR